ncbi:hypothetical protein GLAREA_07177 [Glarea lozoyensis ATCC 20868]|uniref:Uncharacterized protein n=1 Tax=Glarea lozoyensis (strain ATCC 20868 / MF5171) TaxID=1116229 RepID=S3DAL9_GLAL2|nr:uncharacterized protein GLAREA_07177 [Glarea lozoyensis ATCC 20868]EPE34164.1 hypothetical protein GLAREA_07177 [Glarea lozoyensis ATCC 20868]
MGLKLTYLQLITALLSFVAIAQENGNAAACRTVSSVIAACERLTPGFTSFTNFNFQAPCLCYASTYWFPNGYDGWIQSCDAGWQTGNPSAYAVATSSNGGPLVTTPCHKVGNILNSAEFTGPVTALVRSVPPPSITNPGEAACATLVGAAAYCNSQSPGFSTLTDFRSQASCYCYSALVFNPTTYDSLWPACVRFLSTASPALYTQFSANGAPVLTTSPCASVGDVRDVRGRSSSFTPTSTGSASSTLQSSPSASSTSVAPARNAAAEYIRNDERSWLGISLVLLLAALF